MKALDKIKKLLALANSDNESEASLAAEKANALLVKHNLTIEDAKDNHCPVGESLISTDPYVRLHQKYVNILIKRYFFVEPYTSRVTVGLTVDGREKRKVQIRFVGTPENVEIARYVFDFLSVAYQTLWLKYKRANKLSEKHREHYYNGITIGLNEKLQKTQKVVEEEMGLVVVKNPEIDEYFENMDNIKTKMVKTPAESTEATDAGYEDGQKLNIRRGVGSKSEKTGKYLTK